MTGDLITLAQFRERFPEYGDLSVGKAARGPVLVCESDQRVSGDFVVDPPCAEGAPATYLFLGDLTVEGNFWNPDGDAGSSVIVEGTLRADNIVAGGAFVYARAAEVGGVVLGRYNHGSLWLLSLACDLVISLDHDFYAKASGPEVSISYGPYSGYEVQVDALRLPFEVLYGVVDAALLSFFEGTEWLDVDSPEPGAASAPGGEVEYDLELDEWVFHQLARGHEAAEAEFRRLSGHIRAAFVEAAG